MALQTRNGLARIMKFPKVNRSWLNKRSDTAAGTSDGTPVANRPEQTPTNAALVAMSNSYRGTIPLLVGPGIDKTRTFFLSEIAPLVISMTNGMQDGMDVLRQVMQEEPQASEYFNAMNQMLSVALKTKMASFVANHCSLSRAEHETFMQEIFNKPKEPQSVADAIRSLADSGKSETPAGNIGGPKPSRRALRRANIVNQKTQPT